MRPRMSVWLAGAGDGGGGGGGVGGDDRAGRRVGDGGLVINTNE